MLSDFLLIQRKLQEEKKNQYSDELNRLKTEKIETMKYISILENNDEQNSTSFSPYESNTEDKIKLKELRKKLYQINDNIDNIESNIDDIEKFVSEYDDNIKEARKLERARYDLEEQALEGLDIMDSQEIRQFRLNILSTQEQERTRIARELHDSPVQLLTALTHKLELSARLVDLDPIRSKLELINASRSLKESIKEMRRIIYDLKPMALDDLGLKVSLERELSRLEEMSGVEIVLDITGDIDHNSQVMNATIFRIVQEACNNAIKHAEPSKIEVKFTVENNCINFHIIDNGSGFDTSSHEVHTKKEWYGFGMDTMKERIFLLSGKLIVKSRVGTGTDIFVRIPFEKGEMKNGN